MATRPLGVRDLANDASFRTLSPPAQQRVFEMVSADDQEFAALRPEVQIAVRRKLLTGLQIPEQITAADVSRPEARKVGPIRSPFRAPDDKPVPARRETTMRAAPSGVMPPLLKPVPMRVGDVEGSRIEHQVMAGAERMIGGAARTGEAVYDIAGEGAKLAEEAGIPGAEFMRNQFDILQRTADTEARKWEDRADARPGAANITAAIEEGNLRGATEELVAAAANQAPQLAATGLSLLVTGGASVEPMIANGIRVAMQRFVAAGLPAFPQEVGEIRRRQLDNGVDAPVEAITLGAAAAGLEGLFESGLAGRMAARAADALAPTGVEKIAKEAGQEAIRGAVTEGATEPTQSVVERYGAGEELTSPRAVAEYIESALQGAGVGGIVGGGAPVVQAAATAPKRAAERTARRMAGEEAIVEAARTVVPGGPAESDVQRAIRQAIMYPGSLPRITRRPETGKKEPAPQSKSPEPPPDDISAMSDEDLAAAISKQVEDEEAARQPSYTGPERRQDIVTRKRIAEMTPEELVTEIMTDRLTGLKSRRALDERVVRVDPDKTEHYDVPAVAHLDVDSLAWVNDNMGHDRGDELLQKVGLALREEGLDAFRKGGDEITVLGDSVDELKHRLERAWGRLAESTIKADLPDGRALTYTGLGVSHGTGTNSSEAELALAAAKAQREREGIRAPRKQRPKGVQEWPAEVAGESPAGDEAQGGTGAAEAGEVAGRGADGVADGIARALTEQRSLTHRDLQKLGNEAFGGSLAENTYSVQQLYDAAELGFNRYIQQNANSYPVDAAPDLAKDLIGRLERENRQLPTQTRRTTEKESLQQFSTPWAYAYLANWAASVKPGDMVLEPSAGNGNLAVFSKNTGARVWANEIDKNRMASLSSLGLEGVTGIDAQYLNSALPHDITPTVIVMNPPFSRAGHRVSGRDTTIGAQHVEQALKRLAPGGRLVAIVGRGMKPDAPSFVAWWSQVRREYAVRANIGIPGRVYAPMGTMFGTRLLVIDKAPVADIAPVTGDVESLQAAVDLLKEVRDGRQLARAEAPEKQPQPGGTTAAPPGGPGGIGPGAGPVQPPTPPVGPGDRGAAGGESGQGAGRTPGVRVETGVGETGGGGQAPVAGPGAGGQPGRDSGGSGGLERPEGGGELPGGPPVPQQPGVGTIDSGLAPTQDVNAMSDEDLAKAISEQVAAEQGPQVPGASSRPAVSPPTPAPGGELGVIPPGRGGPSSRAQEKINAIREERRKLIEDLRRARQGKITAGVDPTEVVIMVKILRTYVQEGVVRFADAARRFVGDYGEGYATLARHFEVGWGMLAKGNPAMDAAGSFDEAIKESPAPAPEEKLKPEVEEPSPDTKNLDDQVIFDPYKPSKLKIEGAAEHPGLLIESASMAAVEMPDPTYVPKLPKERIDGSKEWRRFNIDTGKWETTRDVAWSLPQLEAIVYAGQAHTQFLSGDRGIQERRGFAIGDGTGVGKGREIAGIILDNFSQGRKRALWISKSWNLAEDATRDWVDVGGHRDDIKPLNMKLDSAGNIAISDGIGFLTYSSLGYKFGRGKMTEEKESDKPQWVERIVRWLGEDFDGVLVFDESHEMGNALTMDAGFRGKKKPSLQALAGVELQRRLPKARIVYVSATMSTEVSNLSYMDRLGLWGRNTAFADKKDFISKISEGGLAAMELVARDLKAQGSYLARQLAFNDGTPEGTVTYRNLDHDLTDHQKYVYNEIADAWTLIFDNVEAALRVVAGKRDRSGDWIVDSKTRSQAMSQLYGLQQRFFNQILTSTMMPTIAEDIGRQLEAGNSVVLQIVNHHEAQQERSIAAAKSKEDLEDLDLTPREALVQMVDAAFPVIQLTEEEDKDHNRKMVAVLGPDGKPVINPEAQKLKEELLDRLRSLRVPDGPLEELFKRYGTARVAEITGRKRRVVPVPQEDGTFRTMIESRNSKAANRAETAAFMDGKKRLLVFSSAGAAGRSYHADRRAKNQQRRVHYVIQAGWRADMATQGFGRSHRSNQRVAPEFVLCRSSIPGHRRFIASIARRLDQLGALTRGERRAGSTGIFSSADNLESNEATDALRNLFEDINRNQIPAWTTDRFQNLTRLTIADDQGATLSDLPTMQRFLNRLLMLKVEDQQSLFSEFEERHKERVRLGIESGTLDVGMETIKADRIEQEAEEVVRKDEKTGAETKYVRLKLMHRNIPFTWEMVQAKVGLGAAPEFYVESIQSGIVYAGAEGGTYTNASGDVIKQYRLMSASGWHKVPKEKIDNDKEGRYWKKISAEEAERRWPEQVERAPKYNSRPEHLITGSILPIWDRLPTNKTRVYRARLSDGRTILGRSIPHNQLEDTLLRLGVKATTTYSPEELWNGLESGAIKTVVLANNWRIGKWTVAGETRINLTGPDFFHQQKLVEDGVFKERFGGVTLLSIPFGKKGLPVFERVLSYSAVFQVNWTPNVHQKETTSPEADVSGMPGQGQVGGQRPPRPTAPQTAERVAPDTIMDFVRKTMGFTVRWGHLHPLMKAVGYWDPFHEHIRVKRAFNLDTVAHEVGHGIHKRVLGKRFKFPRPVLNELIELGKELYGERKPPGGYASEGFAELMRYYLTWEDELQKKAPQANAWLVGAMFDLNPEIAKQLMQLQGMMYTYRDQGALARARMQIRWKPKQHLPSGSSLLRKARTYVTDRFEPLRWIVSEIMSTPLPEGKDPYILARALADTAPGQARAAVLGAGILDFRRQVRYESLADVLAPIIKEYGSDGVQDLILFAYAQRTIELSPRKIDTGLSVRDAVAINNELRDRKGFIRAAEGINNWNHALIDVLADAGALSRDGAQRIKDSAAFYIPLMREFEPDEAPSGAKPGSGKGFVDQPNPVKSIRGSGRMVKDPLGAMIAQAQRFFDLANRARVARALANLIDSHENTGRFMQKVPAPLDVTTTTISRIERQLRAAGADLSGADMDALLTIFTQSPVYRGKESIVTVVRGNKRDFYDVVNPDLWAALKGLSAVEMPHVVNLVFGAPARAVRLGATGLNAAFALATNPIRDVWAAMIQSQDPGFGVPYRATKALVMDLMGENRAAALWRAQGGELSTFLGIDARATQDLRAELVAGKGLRGKAKFTLMHPIDALREALTFTESANRMAEYERVYETATRQGKSQQDAAIAALYASKEVTTDFTRGGLYSRVLNQYIPFFNAAIQGASKFGRSLRERPVQTALWALASITAPMLALWWAHKDEEWYEELPLWEKTLFMHLKIGDEVLRIPLPFEWGAMFGAIPVAAAEAARRDKPEEFARVTKQVLNNMMPDAIPAVAKPSLEIAMNRDIFREWVPIVPQGLEKVDPIEQYHRNTSNVYKWLGKVTGMSPLKVQHFVEGHTGGLSRTFTDPIKPPEERELADVPVVGRLFSRKNRYGASVDTLYRKFGEADRVALTIGKMRSEKRYAEAIRYATDHADVLGFQANKPKSVTALSKAMRVEGAPINIYFHRLQKLREARDAIAEARKGREFEEATAIARRALGREK